MVNRSHPFVGDPDDDDAPLPEDDSFDDEDEGYDDEEMGNDLEIDTEDAPF